MVNFAAELSEQDVNDLAEHYAALLYPRAAQSSGHDDGRALADRLRCATATDRRFRVRTPVRHGSLGKGRLTPPGRCS
jgi:hypothetical protein